MRLTGSQYEELTLALLDAFPSRARLEMMLLYKLSKKLDTISQSSSQEEIIYEVIKMAETHGWTGALIMGACKHSPNNEALQRFSANISRQNGLGSTPTIHLVDEPAPRSLQSSNFDLTLLIEETLEYVDGKQGIVGLVVRCDVDLFLKNYCNRLKYALGRQQTHIYPTLHLKPTNVSIDEALTIIKHTKRNLQEKDILYPIVFQVFEQQIANQFWQKVDELFQESYSKRLMLILCGDSSTVFPEQLSVLPPPQFKLAHVIDWVGRVVEQRNWPHSMREAWKQKMLVECSFGNILSTQLVYDHLEFTIDLLQKNTTYELFLEELESRC